MDDVQHMKRVEPKIFNLHYSIQRQTLSNIFCLRFRSFSYETIELAELITNICTSVPLFVPFRKYGVLKVCACKQFVIKREADTRLSMSAGLRAISAYVETANYVMQYAVVVGYLGSMPIVANFPT